MRPSLRRGTIALLAVVSALALSGGGSAATRKAALSPGEGKGVGFCGGQQLGMNFLDVWACGPRPGYSQPGWPGNDFEAAGEGFQCVELANRFLWAIFGFTPTTGQSLDGANYVDSFYNSHYNTPKVANGTHVPYLPGDVVSFSDGSFGHLAVVTGSTENAAGNGTVLFMEENLSPDGGDVATVSNWTLGKINGTDTHLQGTSETPVNFLAPVHIFEIGSTYYLVTPGNTEVRRLQFPAKTRNCLVADGVADLGSLNAPALPRSPPARHSPVRTSTTTARSTAATFRCSSRTTTPVGPLPT